MIEAGAQVDATLALVELELPQWRLRRLLFDNDQWFCALSRQFYFSVEFDDTADGHHADPVLAMLERISAGLNRDSLAGFDGRHLRH
ncbi:MAG: hypothetical protein WB624_18215 [Xanthobacteraceae bacterium]